MHLEIDAIKDGSTWCNPVDTLRQAYAVGATTRSPSASTSPPDAVRALTFTHLRRHAEQLRRRRCADCPARTNCAGRQPGRQRRRYSGQRRPHQPLTWASAGTATPSACQPSCDTDRTTGPGAGKARLDCLDIDRPLHLTDRATSSFPLAVVTFDVLAQGIDTMDLSAWFSVARSALRSEAATHR